MKNRQTVTAAAIATTLTLGGLGRTAESAPTPAADQSGGAVGSAAMTNRQIAAKFTAAPLRNRLRVELGAPVSEVWALLGDLTRFPEYSSGLERVDAINDSEGALTQYVCHFRPVEEGAPGITHLELVRWYEPERGYASSGEEGNVFGLRNDLNLVTLEPSKDGTLLTWDEYYDSEDLDMSRASYDEALADIAANLIRRFGGRLVERYVDGPVKGRG